jgi:Heparinase II/III-like protein/Heparinase II/III N-terminus
MDGLESRPQGHEGNRRLIRILSRFWKQPAPVAPRPLGFESQLADAGLSFAAWRAELRRQPRLYTHVPRDRLTRLTVLLPEFAVSTRSTAEQILRHQFSLLGSGPYTPVDPDRPPRADGYRPIDWRLDPICRLRFPSGIPHKEWNLMTMRPGLADIKLPWELARAQHLPVLGQAYLLTDDDRFAREVVDQILDFHEANPVGLGIHWTCSMDVAIRAVNWAIALQMTGGCDHIDEPLWSAAYAALHAQGRFLRENLENHYEVTSNHYLSNIVGLFFLATVLAPLADAREWERFARIELEREITAQVLDDGMDYESSVPYHRLVTELFLGAARLAEWRGAPLSEQYRERLRRMLAFLEGVLRPDGLLPQVGDADDGRLHILSGYARTTPQDPRHLFGPAGCYFHNRDWLALAGPTGAWEAAWWGYPTPDPLPSPPKFARFDRLYADAGLAVVREEQTYLLITNSIVGTKGFGNHKHNDQLSFEYHARGVPLVVDPGSYVYTSDPEARNLFRSTAYHNTLQIDDAEQNEVRPEWLFRMFETARAEHLEQTTTDTAFVYRGRHHGYARLAAPVVHERAFHLERASGDLSWTDVLEGQGDHHLCWRLHFAPGVLVEATGPGELRLSAPGTSARLLLPEGIAVTIRPAWYSPSYGVRTECLSLEATLSFPLTGRHAWRFELLPQDRPKPDPSAPPSTNWLVAGAVASPEGQPC